MSRPSIVSLEPMCLADIWTDICRVAEALGDADRGTQLAASLQQRLAEIHASVPDSSTQPTIFCMEWLKPVMSAGNWGPELVEIAGGRAVLGEAGKHSPNLSWDDLISEDPDVIAVMPCGFDIDRTLAEIKSITQHPQWSQLKAVQDGRVYVTDGNQYFNRPGPRVVESAEILRQLLHEHHATDDVNPPRWVRLP